MSRKRLTNPRQASPPPASYGWEPDHPAYKADPEADAYENGDTSSWAEDPTTGPYPNGPPPADPGYQDEPDHPAAKKARDLRASVERKAAKCIRIAQSMLGGNATTEEIEDQALDLMDLPDRQINASLNRIRTAFLTAEEEEVDEMQVDEAMLADFLADSEDPTVNTAESEDPSGIMAELESMKAELEAMRGGQDQNDPADAVLAPDAHGLVPETSEEMVIEEEGPMADQCGEDMGQDEASNLDVDAKMGDDEEKSAHSIFDLYDVDGDGFITAEEWGGSPAVFEALDTDGDGILSRDEISMGLGDGMTASLKEEADDDGTEAMLAEMLSEEEKKSCGEGVTASDMKAELDSMKAELDALKLAAKSGEDEEKAKKDEEKGEEEAAETVQEEVEEGAEEADKEASDESELVMTADVHDPMGLSADVDIDEDAVLAELFGKSAKAGEDKEEKEEHDEDAAEDDEEHIEDLEEDKADEEEDLKEEKKASLRPQAKKESSGVKSLGAVSKTASNDINDINELSKLWQSAPDVSSIFGV